MDAARWQRIQDLFHDTADLPKADQRSYLGTACGKDHAMVDEVLALIEEDSRGCSLLDRDVANVAHEVLDDPASAPVFPQGFGPYRIVGVLGEGGMGVVYLAKREDLGSRAAIKILRDAWVSPVRRERFAAEQRMLAGLNHPSIARLYDAGTLPDGTPWFVMEYVEGAPLTEFCAREGASIERRLKLFRSVCEAVQYAHLRALIHRDLKPSNILVKADGGVRLLDFGIAKQLENADASADQTQTALRLMTPAYAAPEQIRGEPVGIYTDVYALGVVLYELLAGRLPFDLSRRTPGEAELIIVGQEPPPPSPVDDLNVLCLTAMHKDVQRRYQSTEALIRDVDHYLQGEPLEARPDSLRYRAGKFVRRHRRAVAATALVSAAVLALAIFFTVRLAIARDAALAEAARTQRIQRFMLNLFDGGDKDVGPADSLRVLTLVDRGLQDARSLDSEPAIQAELYQTLGSIYQKLGKFDQADTLLRSALEKRRSLFGSDSPAAAESLVALGLLRHDQARMDEAERLVRQGLEISKRKLPAGHPAIAKATVALGKVLEDRGAHAQAIPVLEEAVRLRSAAGPATSDLAAALSELANTHFYEGHYDLSESLNQRALAINRQLYGDRHPLVADALVNLGAIEFQRGRYPQAEKYYRQALEIALSFYGKEHPETASELNMLGQTLVFEERYDEAEAALRQALLIRERVFGGLHPFVASTLNELGSLALRRGKLDDAEAQFRRMADIYRAAYGDRDYRVALAMSNLASVYLKRQQYARAEPVYRDVVRRFAEALSPDHINTGIARIKLGRALVGEHRYAEAEGELLAGYAILKKQTSPSVSWLQNARKDLVTVYEALRQPEKARQFRAELEATASQDK